MKQNLNYFSRYKNVANTKKSYLINTTERSKEDGMNLILHVQKL